MTFKIITVYTRPNTGVNWWVKPDHIRSMEEDGCPWLDHSIDLSSDGLTLTEVTLLEDNCNIVIREETKMKLSYYEANNVTSERLYEHLDDTGKLIRTYTTYSEFRHDVLLKN